MIKINAALIYSIGSSITLKCSSSEIIDGNQLSSTHNILSTTKLKQKQQKQTSLTTIEQNGYCWKLAPIPA